MQDTKLFETILGITTPWHITRVELKTEGNRVDLWLEHDPTRWPCPECDAKLAAFDHAEGAAVAASGHLPVSDAPPRGDSARALFDARRQASPRAVGGTAQSLHAADGAAGD